MPAEAERVIAQIADPQVLLWALAFWVGYGLGEELRLLLPDD